jgi:hypothetical protein
MEGIKAKYRQTTCIHRVKNKVVTNKQGLRGAQ